MPDLGESLSKRELDVLQAMYNGGSNKEIANELVISPNTVKVHVRNIFTKMGANSRTEAVTMGMEQGLLQGVVVVVDEPGDATVPPTDEADPHQTIPKPTAEELFAESVFQPELTQPEPKPIAAAPAVPEPATSSRRLLYLGVGLVLLLAAIGAGAFSLLQGSAIPQATPEPFVDIELSEHGWFESQSLAEPRSGMALTSVGVTLYQIGGETADGIDNEVFSFDTRNRNWQPLMEKPTAVSRAGAAVAVGQIYVAGGQTSEGSTATVEVYSPTSDAWRSVASLPRPLAGMLLVASSERLFAFGGDEDGSVSAESFTYDPIEDNWRPLPAMSIARTDAAGAVINGEVMIVGGSDGTTELSSCEIFNIAEETWRDCPAMLENRSGARAVSLAGKLYVIGGGASNNVSYGEAFDDTNGTWQVVNVPMLVSSSGWTAPGVAVVETRIYMLGGAIDGVLQNGNYYYTPLQFRFFFPSTNSGS